MWFKYSEYCLARSMRFKLYAMGMLFAVLRVCIQMFMRAGSRSSKKLNIIVCRCSCTWNFVCNNVAFGFMFFMQTDCAPCVWIGFFFWLFADGLLRYSFTGCSFISSHCSTFFPSYFTLLNAFLLLVVALFALFPSYGRVSSFAVCHPTWNTYEMKSKKRRPNSIRKRILWNFFQCAFFRWSFGHWPPVELYSVRLWVCAFFFGGMLMNDEMMKFHAWQFKYQACCVCLHCDCVDTQC